ncbi:MAG: sulfurtransferase TusA family protein [Alphaproteobacteria bacterium]
MKQATRTLDATGLLCPLPVLRAQKVLREMAPGTVLEVHTTDPASWTDMPAFCGDAGHTLLARHRTENQMTFVIERT